MEKFDKTNAKDAATAAPAMVAAMLAVKPVATQAWLDVISESARFMADRLQRDLETQRAMLACKNPADLLKLQSEFVKTSLEHYTEEATRLFKMMPRVTQATLEDTRSGHARGYDDVPL